MATSTTFFGLSKPAVNSATDADLWGGELNTDLDNIDTVLKASLNWVYTAKVASFSITAPTAASATIADAKKLFVCDAAGGAIVPSLPAAASSTNMVVGIKKKDSSVNSVTITANGAELIDGSNTLVLSLQYNWAILVCDGTGWQIISQSGATSSGSKVNTYQVTDSTDISLSNAPTKANVGSTTSVTIPTKGRIEIVFTGEIIIGAGADGITFGIRIGSTNYWPVINDVGGTEYVSGAEGGVGTSVYSNYGSVRIGGGNQGAHIIGLGIEENSIPTGPQTIQVIAATAAGGTVTIKGTIVTTRIYLAIYDHS